MQTQIVSRSDNFQAQKLSESDNFQTQIVSRSDNFLKQKMDPSYIYFNEIDINQDNTFTANLLKDNEIEKIVFNKENEYGVSGLNINVDLPDEKILKIDNKKEQEKISQEFQELIKQNKEPNLTFIISPPETKSIEIPFVKKMKQNYQRKTDFF